MPDIVLAGKLTIALGCAGLTIVFLTNSWTLGVDRRRFDRPARIALALASFALSFAVLEVVVRLAELAPQVQVLKTHDGAYMTTEDPDLPYVPNPAHFFFNDLGFRDPPRDPEAAGGRPRIFVIGDSLAMGASLRREQAFPARLEVHLREGSDLFASAEVWNLAVSGYTTRHEVAYLKREGLQYAPDLVLVAFCMNDFYRHSTELDQVEALRGFEDQRRLQRALARSPLFGSELVRLVWWRLGGAHEQTSGEVSSDGRQDVGAAFARLAELADQANFQVVVVVFPYLVPFEDYGFSEMHELVALLARQNGLAVYDLMPRFHRAYGDDVKELKTHHSDAIHLSAAANDTAARSVARYLDRRARAGGS